MEIIQSFWSKPFVKNDKNLLSGRFNGGWYNYQLNFLGWTLSCLTLLKNHKKVTLYTDKIGKELLIDILQLPYTDVVVTLDDLNSYDDNLWALGKLYTYSIQKKPFLHVDGDIFISEEFPKELMCKEVITQSAEYNLPFYQEFVNEALVNLEEIPNEIIKNSTLQSNFGGVNAGIIGGNNIEFLTRYSKMAIDFVNKNKNNLKNINISNFNIFYEQYFLKCLAKEENIEISFLLENISNDFHELTQFQLHPNENKFIHMVGYSKRQIILCEQLMILFKLEFPEYYDKTIKILNNNKYFS